MAGTPQFQLIIGPSGPYYYFKDEIVERIQKSFSSTRKNNLLDTEASHQFTYDFIYLLPVKRAVRYFKEQLIDASPRDVLPDPPVFTFYEFMVHVYRRFPGARKVISQAMRLFLVEEILKKNIRRLTFFSPVSARRRGLIRKVDELLTELREYGYSSQELVQGLEEEDRRLHDFALLIDEFEAILGRRLIDEAGAIQQVLDRLDGETWRKLFPHVEVIYMNGYGLFTRPMFRFFEMIRQVCSVKIKLDYLPEHPQLFEHVQPAYEELCKLNPIILQDRKPEPWERQLFQRRRVQQRLEIPGKEVLVQFCANRREEVSFIANYVKRLHLHRGIPLHEIGITFPSPEQYAPLIHEVFTRHNLPYNISTGFPLSQSPLVRSFLLLLEIPLEQYDLKRLLQLITSPFYQPVEDLYLDPESVKLLGQELRLTHLHGHWQERLENHLDYLKQRVETAPTEDEFDLRRLRKAVEKLEHLMFVLQRVLTYWEELTRRQPVQQFREEYLRLLRDFGFLDWYQQPNPHTSPAEKEQEFRAFNRFIKLLDQFSWIVTNLHGNRKLSLQDFYQYLSLLVSQATYNVREWPNYGVQIMPRLEILAITPRVLIFGGMVEGDFPRPFTQDVFFHDEEREQLGLAATEDLLAQDRFMFYQLLAGSAERLVFTCPRFQKEVALVPSNFLDILGDQMEVRQRTQLPSASFLHSSRDLLQRIARHIRADIGAREVALLRRWRHLQADDPVRITQAAFWLHRVRTNYLKRRSDSFSEYEGMIGRDPAIRQWLSERFGEGPFSVTRLETFAFCPIKFYFRYILHLEEEEEVRKGLTPLERGQLVHGILFRFYHALREAGKLDRPWEERDLLHRIAAEEFDRLPFRGLLFELEREKYFGAANHPGLLDRFLEQEQAYITRWQFYPRYFEVAFGRAGEKREQDPISRPEPCTVEHNGKQVQIIGKVDRVDMNEQGQVVLLDYKTGAGKITPAEVREGLSLQLPVYAAVISELLPREETEPIIQPVMAAIYRVAEVDICDRVPVIFDKEADTSISLRGNAALPNSTILDEQDHPITFQGMLERALRFVIEDVEQIRRGEFRHTRFPTQDACTRYCEYRRMCRKDIRKITEFEQKA